MIKVELKAGTHILEQIIRTAKEAGYIAAKEIDFILVSHDVQTALLTSKKNFETFDLRILPDNRIMYVSIQLITSADLPDNSCYLLTLNNKR